MKWYSDLLLNSSAAGTEVPPERIARSSAATGRCLRSSSGPTTGISRACTDDGQAWPAQRESVECRQLSCVDGGRPHADLHRAEGRRTRACHTFYIDELREKGLLEEKQHRLLRSTLVVTIFPNLSFVYFPGLCSIWRLAPKAPGETELWSWALYNKDAPDVIIGPDTEAGRRGCSRPPWDARAGRDLEVWSRLESNPHGHAPSGLSSLLRVRRGRGAAREAASGQDGIAAIRYAGLRVLQPLGGGLCGRGQAMIGTTSSGCSTTRRTCSTRGCFTSGWKPA